RYFFFSSRRRHTRFSRDWSSDVCSSDLDYNGNSPRTVWTHLHFSIVRDDGSGHYTNELEFANTLDPSPYLGMEVHYERAEEVARSEERRVGKECRWRWAGYHETIT